MEQSGFVWRTPRGLRHEVVHIVGVRWAWRQFLARMQPTVPPTHLFHKADHNTPAKISDLPQR